MGAMTLHANDRGLMMMLLSVQMSMLTLMFVQALALALWQMQVAVAIQRKEVGPLGTLSSKAADRNLDALC